MANPFRKLNPLLLFAVSPLIANSCSDRDPLVDEVVRSQGRQQEALARQSEELVKVSQQLVEADSKARREQAEHHAQLQAQLESQRENIDTQRDSLEAERRQIAQQRHRDPLIAAALVQGATLLIAALPIVLLIFLIRAARSEPADAPLGELLIHDMTSEAPLLLPPPLTDPQANHLPAPEPSGHTSNIPLDGDAPSLPC